MEYLTPDVYVHEVPGGTRPIEAVGTSGAALLGTAPKADAPKLEPTLITNWHAFVERFVGPLDGSRPPRATPLVHAVRGFFENGGGRVFVVHLSGVHKAPANEMLRGALGVTHRLDGEQQKLLNPQGVNAIRHFTDEGIVVWGARTVAPSNSEFRYVNVRRLTNMIKQSIQRSTRWIVFEPNDDRLWALVKRDLEAFLLTIWRDGALRGTTPEQAFFVKCDAETNPRESIDAGRLTALIGISPVKPAEFVIFQISQEVPTAAVATEATEGEA